MSHKDTLFYRENKSILLNFSSEQISSDGSLILLEKLERKHKLIKMFSKFILDDRTENLIDYTREDQLKQRVFMLNAKIHGISFV